MQLLDWPFLDALQTGALLVLCALFGTDALFRRDRLMGWLSVSCLLMGLRHLILALGPLPILTPELVDRLQSLAVALGFIALSKAMVALFPHHVPRRFPLWITLGMVPNFLRNLVLARHGWGDAWMRHAYDLTYLLACAGMILWTLRARQDGDPMGRRLFFGLVGLTVPVVVEVTALSLFDLKVRLSGVALVILAIAIGSSWQWLVVNAMETRIRQSETEVDIWRSLIPGKAFRTDQASAPMAELFGPDWAARVRAHPEEPLKGLDGERYRLTCRRLYGDERMGWYEQVEDAEPGTMGFLAGWTVALGIDEPALLARVQAWLGKWGADVKVWGTMPPREGPYPSLLIWGREPSILAVWREDDLVRRRARWVQVGGPATEGPHVRLDANLGEEALRQALVGLLSAH